MANLKLLIFRPLNWRPTQVRGLFTLEPLFFTHLQASSNLYYSSSMKRQMQNMFQQQFILLGLYTFNRMKKLNK
jgi:hypothetical protein